MFEYSCTRYVRSELPRTATYDIQATVFSKMEQYAARSCTSSKPVQSRRTSGSDVGGSQGVPDQRRQTIRIDSRTCCTVKTRIGFKKSSELPDGSRTPARASEKLRSSSLRFVQNSRNAETADKYRLEIPMTTRARFPVMGHMHVRQTRSEQRSPSQVHFRLLTRRKMRRTANRAAVTWSVDTPEGKECLELHSS